MTLKNYSESKGGDPVIPEDIKKGMPIVRDFLKEIRERYHSINPQEKTIIYNIFRLRMNKWNKEIYPDVESTVRKALENLCGEVTGKISINQIVYTSHGKAMKIIPEKNSGIISISDKGDEDAHLNNRWNYRLDMYFNDNDYDFNEFHARQMINWLEKIEGKVEKLWVHCNQGISRSPAVGLWLSERYHVPFKPNHSYNRHVHNTLKKFDEWWRKNKEKETSRVGLEPTTP